MTGKKEKEKNAQDQISFMLINKTKTFYRVNRTGEINKSKVSVNMIY
jgi:hypothetical protein